MTIKKWFLEKNFLQNERYVIETGNLEVVKETEKAFQFKCESDYGSFTFWCPKSCTETGSGEKRFASSKELEQIKKTGKTIVSNTGRRFALA